MKKRKKSTTILLSAVLLMLIIFLVTVIAVSGTTYDKKVAAEKFDQPDFYSMQKYCADNASAVMDALRSGSDQKLEKLMISIEGVDEVMSFAEWKKADFENAVSMGAGSLTPSPDDQGRMDISERFIVDVEGAKYVLFIETLTSRWGMNNEGVSAVAVTSFGHFDGLDYGWSGKKDDQSALAGELFWNQKKEK